MSTCTSRSTGKSCTNGEVCAPMNEAVEEHDGWDQYKTYEERLETFRRWPGWAGVRPEDLAKEGFYYTGIRDEVRCISCEQLLRLWRPNEDIRQRHRRYSPNCNFIRSLESPHPGEEGHMVPPHSPRHGLPETKLFSDMRYEEKRLRSFQGFPSCPVQPAELAHAGFYYTGRFDAVQCFSCHIALRGWEKGDTAEGEHRRHNPFCPFLNRTDTTNVPIEESVSSTEAMQTMEPQPPQNAQFEHIRVASFKNWPSSAPVTADDLAEAGFYYVGERDAVCCFHCGVKIEQWVPGDVAIDEHLRHSPDCSYARQVAQRKQQYQNYATPNAEATSETMASYEKRLMSFKDWPATAPVSAESLAMAGFYYSGSGDGVRCFSCHGALKGWQEGDMAWEEHAKYFPSCDFVRQHDPTLPQSYDEPWTRPSTEIQIQPTSWYSQSTSVNEEDFLQQATSMGFSRDLAQWVLYQHSTHNVGIAALLEILLEAQEQEEKASLLTASQISQITSSSTSASPTPNATLQETLNTGRLQPTAPEETEEIRRELETTQESRLCKVCMDKEVTILFLPCAHILCCEDCAMTMDRCPVCRASIDSKIRSYFA